MTTEAGQECNSNVMSTPEECGAAMPQIQPMRLQGVPTALRLGRLHAHPRDSRAVFDENQHKYYLDADLLFPVSVSGVWSQYFSKFDGPAIVDKYFNSWASNPASKYFDLIHDGRANGINTHGYGTCRPAARTPAREPFAHQWQRKHSQRHNPQAKP